MRTPPRSTQILITLCEKFLSKLQKSFTSKHGGATPIILVAGTAGKSTTTLLIKEMFEKDGWKVFSGASRTTCLNSLSGFVMALGEFRTNFEGRGGGLQKIWFLLQAQFLLWFKEFYLPKKSIVVYEIGFNEQYESEYFTSFLKNQADLLVVTNLTWEHSFGFEDKFDITAYESLKDKLPLELAAQFEGSDIDGKLKNIALEQLKLLVTANNVILPATIGNIDNQLIVSSFKGFELLSPKVERVDAIGLLVGDRLAMDKKYLFPITMGKTASTLEQVALKFELKTESLHFILGDMSVPNGRFSVLKGVLGTTIIDSTYNSDPASLSGFLQTVDETILSKQTALKASQSSDDLSNFGEPVPTNYLVIGEMRELGDMATGEHQEILRQIIELKKKHSAYIEDVILLGNEWLKCDSKKLPKSDGHVQFIEFDGVLFRVYARVGDINKDLTEETLRPGSWIWVKGSQNTIFLEALVEHLLANKSDSSRLCRRGTEWNEVRAKWVR